MAKTDNANLAAKLKLRRYFLEKYHRAEAPRVLDCCQGSGVIWRELRRGFPVASYWGVDEKPRKGRLKIDSVRILQQPGWVADVIDIDTYGSPWKHWVALLPNVAAPATIFLTIGQVLLGTDGELLKTLGLGGLSIPPAIAARLQDLGGRHLLGRVHKFGLVIREAWEAPSGTHARYIGVRLEPQKSQQFSTPP